MYKVQFSRIHNWNFWSSDVFFKNCPLKIKEEKIATWIFHSFDVPITFLFGVDHNVLCYSIWHDNGITPTLLYPGQVGLWPGNMQIITLLKRSHSSWRSNRLMEMAARREGSWRGAAGRKWEIISVIQRQVIVSENWIIKDECHGNDLYDQSDCHIQKTSLGSRCPL